MITVVVREWPPRIADWWVKRGFTTGEWGVHDLEPVDLPARPMVDDLITIGAAEFNVRQVKWRDGVCVAFVVFNGLEDSE